MSVLRKKNIAIFGDISTNGVDGSSIWLQSISSIFPKDKFNVYLILRDKIVSRVLLDEMLQVNIVDLFSNPYITKENENSCSTYELFTILKGLDKDYGLDHIILRAPRYLKEFVAKIENSTYKHLLSKVDAYFARLNIYEDDYETTIINKALPYIARIIVQTEEMRSFFDYKFPEHVGRVIVLNPIVPEVRKLNSRSINKKLKKPIMVYAGKLDQQYYVEDFLELLNDENYSNHKMLYIGSKINSSKTDKFFVKRIKEKLEYFESYSNFEWVKQLDRQSTISKVSQASFMLSLRQDVYDTSNEISTKLLEAMSVGTLPILKKTAANIKLIGVDYPGYVNRISEINAVTANIISQPKLYFYWAKKLQDIVGKFTFEYTYSSKLSSYYEVKKITNNPVLKQKKKILIASHDNKFFNRVIRFLQQDSNLEIKFDDWTTTLRHDPKKSKELLQWADVILCEWAVGAAVYYSNNKLEHQKLLVRLHRFEITTSQPGLIDFNNVDKIIVVSDYIKKYCVENFKWGEGKIAVIPQYADIQLFDRPKVMNYQFNLGLLGMVPTLKGFDRALDILEQLRAHDPRYTLYIKSKHPWEIPFVWVKQEEKEFYIAQYKRIEESELLRNGVVFDEYGADVASWLRKIGWMLSTSTIEGCHTAIAEGMAAGAKPLIFNWPGAETVYKNSEVFEDTNAATSYVINHSEFEKNEIANIKQYAKDNFDLTISLEAYNDFIYSSTDKLGV
ncbi:glycosyltransferase involved in cell wall biosynthesis [Acinetobacter calcoaceticus]|uniref:Glycosyltransferase involved in cell wall biosynthesis n=1 Tax=Acinetobacter calcoaceticus TaxID=471 RepID=A0A4R1XX93_ACICA|nr:glycosyltransferase involved in cell wall biosynthesis [Acinetobacter calcoaceticus]